MQEFGSAGAGYTQTMCRPCSYQSFASLVSDFPGRIRRLRRAAIHNARTRRLTFDEAGVTLEYLNHVYGDVLQGRCYYSGQTMTCKLGDPRLISIERIDPSKGYLVDNVTFCIHALNGYRQWTREKFSEVIEMRCVDPGVPRDYEEFVQWATALDSTPMSVFRKMELVDQRIAAKCPSMCFISQVWFNCQRSCQTRAAARHRGHEDHSITITFLWFVEQLVRQNFRCAYSGIFLRFRHHVKWQMSPDRQDNSQGYLDDGRQVLLVCAEFNARAKWSKELVDSVFQ